MELTIHCIKHMRLAPCKHLVTKRNVVLVATATHELLARSSGCSTHAYSDIDTDVGLDQPGGGDTLCTWRPRYCLDIFLYISHDPRDAFLGVVMHGANPTVEYFRCEEQLALSSALVGGIFYGHLTCDTHADDSSQFNILIYDGIPADSAGSIVSVQARYAWIQSLENNLRSMKIADVNLVVQWAGCPAIHPKIAEMPLPHQKGGIVIMKTNAPYTCYAFDPQYTSHGL